MLYSYLLTRGNFTLPTLNGLVSRDKKFANILYHDLLMFVLNLCGHRISGSFPVVKLLQGNKLIAILNSDIEVNTLLESNPEGYNLLVAQADEIIRELSSTHAMRSYVRLKNRNLGDDANVITAILDTVMRKNKNFYEAAHKIAGFTGVGYDMAFDMVIDTITSFSNRKLWYADAKNSLARSLDKAYELYYALLLLISEITHEQALHLDAQKHKHLPTAEDLNPNTKFIDNRLAKIVADKLGDCDHLKDSPFSWIDLNPGLLHRLKDAVVSSDIYAEYMNSSEDSLKEDCDLWRMLLKKIIFPSDDLAEALETLSVYWNDDINIVDSFVIKSIKRVAADGRLELLPKYKDEEDARFGSELFTFAVENYDEYRGLIDMFINQKQWDTERLAFMDIVIMIAAIAEIVNYPEIPVPVSLNEYIEIANCYSTPKSGQFVNGILYSVVNHLKETGKILK